MILILGLCCLPVHAQEKKPFGPTDTELMMLPPYCHAKIKGDANARKMWSSQMGADIFLHIHHYCYGLNFMNRHMLILDEKERSFLAARAISNFDYVIQRWPPSFPLTIEAQKYKAQMQSFRR
jgi:uncharacterized protein YchJ